MNETSLIYLKIKMANINYIQKSMVGAFTIFIRVTNPRQKNSKLLIITIQMSKLQEISNESFVFHISADRKFHQLRFGTEKPEFMKKKKIGNILNTEILLTDFCNKYLLHIGT